VPIDVKKQPWEQKVPLHNRWHPDIPPVADVTEGELFRVEMVDWSGGRVKDDNSADDMKFMDFTIVSLYFFFFCWRRHLIFPLFQCFHCEPN
jgi:formamidase